MNSRRQILRSIGYSEKAAEIIECQTNMSVLENPTVEFTNHSDCGDILKLQMTIENSVIKTAKFQYLGCAGLQLAASVLTMIVEDSSLNDAYRITPEAIIAVAGKIPPEKMECVEFAVESFQKTVQVYLNKGISRPRTGGDNSANSIRECKSCGRSLF